MPMQEDIFQEIVRRRIETCKNLLIVKGAEYTRNGNRLHNFERAAAMKGKDRLEIIDDYNTKQITSFMDMIDDVKAGKAISQKAIDEKFTDIINYFLLAECAVVASNMEVSMQKLKTNS